MTSARNARIEAWLASLDARHRAELRPAEFHKAVRAVSARYVERRADLPRRSPLDSAGKRAAFAGFYAPLHFLIVGGGGGGPPGPPPPAPVDEALDLGCGTGVAGAAWALARGHDAHVVGLDRDAWALDEARWNWRALGVTGRAKKTSGVFFPAPEPRRPTPLLIAAWSINELGAEDRDAVLRAFITHASAGGGALVIEPIARRATPWWSRWTSALGPYGARDDDWRFAAELPPTLARISDAAGFQRDALTARSLYIPPRHNRQTPPA